MNCKFVEVKIDFLKISLNLQVHKIRLINNIEPNKSELFLAYIFWI